MKIPKKLQIIGHVQTVAWVPTKGRSVVDLSWWEGECIIGVNMSRTILFLFPNNVKESYDTNEGTVTKFNAPGGNLKKIGHAFKITYLTNLLEGKDLLYTHDFDENEASIWGTAITRPKVIAIKHSRGLIFKERGIY